MFMVHGAKRSTEANIKTILIDFALVFALAFAVAVVTSFIYELIVHGAGTIGWGTSFRLAIILSVVLTWMGVRDRKKGGRK